MRQASAKSIRRACEALTRGTPQFTTHLYRLMKKKFNATPRNLKANFRVGF